MFSFLIGPFLITQLAELAVGFLFGFRKPNQLLAIFAVNIITNPILNYLLLAYYRYSGNLFLSYPAILFLEFLVFLSEFLMLSFALPKENKIKILAFVLAANTVSLITGRILL